MNIYVYVFIYTYKYVYIYMYVYLYISPHHICICISVFVFAPHMLDCSDKYHTVCTVILVYLCNNQASNVFLSIQFYTNVSQVARDVLPGSYAPLVSLGELSSITLNRLNVCLSCLFWLCMSLVCTVGMYCASAASEWPWFQRERVFFFLSPPQKMDSRHKKRKKMDWRQDWREADVRRQTSTPPHLTTWRQPWQLRRTWVEICV